MWDIFQGNITTNDHVRCKQLFLTPCTFSELFFLLQSNRSCSFSLFYTTLPHSTTPAHALRHEPGCLFLVDEGGHGGQGAAEVLPNVDLLDGGGAVGRLFPRHLHWLPLALHGWDTHARQTLIIMHGTFLRCSCKEARMLHKILFVFAFYIFQWKRWISVYFNFNMAVTPCTCIWKDVSQWKEVERCVRVCVCVWDRLTVLFHAEGHAALQSAVLAAVAVMLIDHTLPWAAARVHEVLADASLEKAFAAFTAHCPIVTTFTTNRQKHYLLLL